MTTPREFKLMPVRECPHGDGSPWQDTGQETLRYWREHIATQPDYNAELEHAAVLYLDAEKRLLGHTLLEQGDQTLVMMDCAKFLTLARMVGAAFIILAHNHPGGDPTPSELDVLAARSFAFQGRACQLPLLDDVVIGDHCFCSFAASGLLVEVAEEKGPEDEPEVVLDKREKWKLATVLMLSDRTLQSLVFDAAHKAGVPPEDLVFDLCRTMTARILKAEPHAEPQASFASWVFAGKESRELLQAVSLKLMKDGNDEKMWAYTWQRGVDLAREEFRALLAAKEPQPAALVAAGE